MHFQSDEEYHGVMVTATDALFIIPSDIHFVTHIMSTWYQVHISHITMVEFFSLLKMVHFRYLSEKQEVMLTYEALLS